MTESDALRLLMRTAEGDAQAFRQLYDQTSGKPTEVLYSTQLVRQ